MKKRNIVIAAMLGIIGLGVFEIHSWIRTTVFCSEIVNPYELNGNYVVNIPEDQRRNFNAEIEKLFRDEGLIVKTSNSPLYEFGNYNKTYTNYRLSACDGFAFVFSGNDVHPDKFLVTFYSNWFFGNKRSKEIEHAFLNQFYKRYNVTKYHNPYA